MDAVAGPNRVLLAGKGAWLGASQVSSVVMWSQGWGIVFPSRGIGPNWARCIVCRWNGSKANCMRRSQPGKRVPNAPRFLVYPSRDQRLPANRSRGRIAVVQGVTPSLQATDSRTYYVSGSVDSSGCSSARPILNSFCLPEGVAVLVGPI